jgi:S1-C subfamily serine protease
VQGRARYAIVMTALSVAAFGGVSAALAPASAGVGIDDTSSVVLSVVPGSPAWRDGIRPGDEIVAFSSSFEPGG